MLGVRAFIALWPTSLPRADAIHVDRPVLLFALALSLATALGCAIGPAIRCLGFTFAAGLRPNRLTQVHVSRRARSALVVAQFAASVILLVGAGLLGRSLSRLLASDIGVMTEHVTVGEMGLGQRTTTDQQIDAVDRVMERVAGIPGVRRVSVTTSLPFNGARLRYTLNDVKTGDGPARDFDVDALAITPSFFSALGVPLLKGRSFSDSDTATSQPVMMMSARTARRFFGDRDPIGQVLSIPSRIRPRADQVTLVGIVGDIKYNALDAPADGGIYRPFRQSPSSFVYLVVQTSNDSSAADALRRSVAQVDRQIAFDEIRTLDDALSRAAEEPRFRTLLLVTLAAVAMTVASIGLYGAMAYSVTLRSTELGIRMALGASPLDVTWMVVKEGIALAFAGAAFGVLAAWALARGVQALLYGVAPTDAVSFIAAPVLLLGLATIASCIPAIRAASSIR